MHFNFSTLVRGALVMVVLMLSACGGGGGSGSSPASGGVTAPPAPTGVAATALGSLQVQFGWNCVPNASSYNIYSATAPGVTTASTKVPVTAPACTTGQVLSATVNAPAAGTYYFAMTALNSAGESPLSTPEGTVGVF